MKNFEQTEDQQTEQVSRTCVANGCPMLKCANDKCLFHNAFPFSSAGYVTRKLKQSEVACKTDDGRTYTITYAQAAQENRVLWALDVFDECARLGDVVYPVRDIAYREYIALWRAGLIPEEVKSIVKDHASLYESMLMQYGHKIKLVNETGFFCTDWLCATYEQFLIDEVAKSVPADIPTEKPSVAEEMGVML